MSSAPKQPIPLGRPSRIARASSLPQPAPLLRRRLGWDKAHFSVCVCVCAPYERPCPPSVFCPDSARRLRPSRLPAHNHRPFSVSLVFAPSSSLLARCMLFSPSAFQPSPHKRPCSPSAFRPSPHDISGRLVFLPTTIVPSPSVLSSRPSLLARCVYSHPHDGFTPLPRSASRSDYVSARRVRASASLRFPLRRRLRTASASSFPAHPSKIRKRERPAGIPHPLLGPPLESSDS